MKHSKLGVAIVRSALFALIVSFVGSPAPAQTTGTNGLPTVLSPYLQNPTADGMTICFLARGAEKVRVVSSAGKRETPARDTAIPGTPWTIWKTRLTGLHPGDTYQYRVLYRLDGQNEETPVYRFRTLNPQAKSVQFAVFNDLHNRDATLAALMQHLKPDDYEFSLLLGDMWTNPSAAKGAEEVFRTLAAYVRLLNASEKPMLLVRGNHETIGNFADKMALLFDLPEMDATAKFEAQNWYYTMRAGPVWFLALDGGDDFTKRYEMFQPIRQRQADWMRRLFADKAPGNATWRILLTHMPLYNDNIWNSEPCRLMWEPVLKDAGINLALAGHDHQWKRIDRDKKFTIHFNAHYPDLMDPQNRKEYSFTPPFPVLIGGGPMIHEATVMLVTADTTTIDAHMLAAKDGRVLVYFNHFLENQIIKPRPVCGGKSTFSGNKSATTESE